MSRCDPCKLCGLRRRRRRAALSGLILAPRFGESSESAETSTPESLAEVNGETISTEDVDRALGASFRHLEEQVYTLRRTQLDVLVADWLLAQEAAKQWISVTALLDTEVTAKVGLVSEQEVDTFYESVCVVLVDVPNGGAAVRRAPEVRVTLVSGLGWRGGAGPWLA